MIILRNKVPKTIMAKSGKSPVQYANLDLPALLPDQKTILENSEAAGHYLETELITNEVGTGRTWVRA